MTRTCCRKNKSISGNNFAKTVGLDNIFSSNESLIEEHNCAKNLSKSKSLNQGADQIFTFCCSSIFQLVKSLKTRGVIGPLYLFRKISHHRRIYTEEKVKVVAAVWGTEFTQFLAALAFLHKDDMKKRMNS